MFDWEILSHEDYKLALDVLGRRPREPDLVIAPSGADRPYLYRWHIVRTLEASVYFHIQVDDDPARPLHDHPWANFSTILSGGYREILSKCDNATLAEEYVREKGDVIYRKASWPHRLLMRPEFPYTMTLFACGPKVRTWGFWYPRGWVSYKDVTRVQDGVSVHVKQEGEQ